MLSPDQSAERQRSDPDRLTGVSPEVAARLHTQLEAWRQELIDLTRRNRLLWYSTGRGSLDLTAPSADEIYSGVLGGGAWHFFEPPAPEPVPPDPTAPPKPRPVRKADELVTDKIERDVLQRTLRGLARRSAQATTDTGIQILHLGFGMLRWRAPEEAEDARSPLLLVPVTLERSSPREPFELIRADGDLVVNPALAVRLQEFGVALPTADDQDDVVLDGLFASVQAACRQWPDWIVEKDRVVLATFSFQKLAMYRDLGENGEAILDHPIVQVLARGGYEEQRFSFAPLPEDRLDEVVPPEALASILDADASQRQCIKAAIDGRTFVVDGPPGTGKSQTIANVIAELISRGKSVLFVSEKAAALDVVQNRLSASGLGEYLLPLHSHKATRKQVAQDLGRALFSQPRPPSGMDLAAVARLRSRRQELTDYARAINEVRQPLGRSLSWAMGRIAQLKDLPRIAWWSGNAATLTIEEFDRILDHAKGLQRNWGPVSLSDDFLWRDLAFEEADMQFVRRLEGMLGEASNRLDAVRDFARSTAVAAGLPWDERLEDARRMLALLDHLTTRPQLPSHWIHGLDLPAVRPRANELQTIWAEVRHLSDSLERIIGPSWRGVDASAAPALRSAETALHEAQPQWILPGTASAEATQAAADLASALVTELSRLRRSALELLRVVGGEERALTLRQIAALAELGMMSAARDRPERAWLSQVTLPALDEAARVLEALVGDYRSRREALTEIFLDEILTLDLETLCVRYEQVYHGPLVIFSAQYRQDRRRLAAATRLGKADKRARTNLRAAREWQRLTESLREAESKHAAILGERYYRTVETDFELLMSAVEKAKRAIELAHGQLGLAHVPEVVAAGSPSDTAVAEAAHRLKAETQALTDRLTTLVPDSVESLLDAPIDQLIAGAPNAAGHLVTISAVVKHVWDATEQQPDLQTVRSALPQRTRIAGLEGDLDASRPTDEALLGQLYTGLSTDWEAIESALAWVQALLALTGSVDADTAEKLLGLKPEPKKLADSLEAWDVQRGSLLALFVPERASALAAGLEGRFLAAHELLDGLLANLPQIDEWLRHLSHVTALSEAGLAEAVTECVAQRLPADQIPGQMERALLEGWVDRHTKRGPASHHRSGVDRDALVEEFRHLDRELIRTSVAAIIENCNARRPASTVGQAGVVQNQANLRRRHMPIRRLLREAGEVAKQLKPCFMMSPLSVSSFLPPDIGFDVVIFDEASQVRPCDAINCIYRGGQLVVAGDQKQLPPTSFFDLHASDGDEPADDDAPQAFDSILDQCKAVRIPSLSLLWHYRSQHEALIGFSNESFYDGNLITFPGAIAEADDLGVHLIRVAGRYQRDRTNPIEAEKVAHRVVQFAELSAQLSQPLTVGVVTFSDAQEDCVSRAVEDAFAARPDLAAFLEGDRLTGFFVKNLESVQGDERDVIIFSIGYGPGANGQFRLQLGPLTQAGGERRLNVAVTRARRRVEIVTSVGPEHFVGELKEGGGVWHLREYLAYAEAGGRMRDVAHDTGRAVESPLEASVASTIESWGYEVVPQVGMSRYRVDLGVRVRGDTSRYILGVECDGAMYHSSQVARDRDRLRHKALTGLGWRLHRIWSPAWYRDRSAEEQRLRAAIEEAAAQPAQIAAREEVVLEASIPEVLEVEIDEPRLDWPEYTTASPARPRHQVEMHLPEAGRELRRMILEVLRVEAPVSFSLCLRRVREAWGVRRAGARIEDQFQTQIAALERDRHLARRGRFLSIPGAAELARPRRPAAGDTARSAEDMPPDEIDLAVKEVAALGRAMKADELTEEVARGLGWGRRGREIQAALDASVQRLCEGGLLQVRGDSVVWQGEGPGGQVRRVTDRPAEAVPPELPLRQVRAGPPPLAPTVASPPPSPPAARQPVQPAHDGVPHDIDRCLTAEGYDEKLKELAAAEEQLRGAEASGDHQAALAAEGRVKTLRGQIDEHRLLPTPTDSSRVAIGCLVSFREPGSDEETWQIVPPLEADVDHSKMSVISAIGRAVLGARVGDVVNVSAASGSYELEITEIALP